MFFGIQLLLLNTSSPINKDVALLIKTPPFYNQESLFSCSAGNATTREKQARSLTHITRENK